METLLLPGMDGTGRLFRELRARLEAVPLVMSSRTTRTRARCWHTAAFSQTRELSYESLAEELEIPPGPLVLIAESFSGPLAIRIAQLRPTQVRAVVLAATFVRNPAGLVTWLGASLGPALFQVRPPAFAVRHALLDGSASDELVAEVVEAIQATSPHVLAARLREIAAVDVAREFQSLEMPLLFLAGRRDRLVRPSSVRKLLALRPDLQIEWLDAPHLVLQTRPDEAAAVIRAFLSGVI